MRIALTLIRDIKCAMFAVGIRVELRGNKVALGEWFRDVSMSVRLVVGALDLRPHFISLFSEGGVGARFPCRIFGIWHMYLHFGSSGKETFVIYEEHMVILYLKSISTTHYVT
jgi:hypothetical protein